MDRRRAVRFGLVFAVGAVLRLVLASGYGLGDDHGYFQAYYKMYTSGVIDTEAAYDFRFAFALPVVAFMHLLGPGEMGFIAFVTLCSLVNLVLIALLARQEWGDDDALLAMALLAVFPLDVLCSTLFVIDVPLATYCFAALWLYREAIRAAEPARRRIAWGVASGIVLFLAYSTKQWAVLVGLLFAAEALADMRRTLVPSIACAGTFFGMLGLYTAWQWARFGDSIYDVHLVRSVALFLPHSRELLLDYPGMLFRPTEYGSFFAGFYPHALVLLAVIFAPRAGKAGKWLLYTAVLLLALAAAPSHREGGRWVLPVPHIFRYLCLLSIPLCLALVAYLREVRRVSPGPGTVAVGVFLALSLWQTVDLTAVTRDAFGEERRVVRALRAFPDETLWLDYNLGLRFENLDRIPTRIGRVTVLKSETPEARERELGGIQEGVVVTGGGRLPWYGCHRCTANLGSIVPPATWTLVTTWEGRPAPYRAEPVRIWRVSAADARARELLAATPDPSARPTLLRDLLARGDHVIAAAVGDQLVAGQEAPPVELVDLTANALLRAQRYARAEELLRGRLARGAEGPALAETLVGLVLAAAGRTDFAEAARWLAEYHRLVPGNAIEPRLVEVESGIAEVIARYNQVRYREAVARARALLTHPSIDIRRRAHYFLALSLFRMTQLARAADETARYRGVYGEDDLWLELHFRQAEAWRRRDPTTAHEILADIVGRFPSSVWAAEARRTLAEGGA
jgi:4-amino-4-deoxy-L-arabinose transferase-like glycosyltransferase